MTERRKILDLFDEQNDYVEEKVSHGIEAYRKGDGKVRIVDKNGKPVVGAKIKFSQKSHEFRFGANIFMLDEFECEEKYYEDNRKEFEELKQELKKTKVDVSKVKKERAIKAVEKEIAELEEALAKAKKKLNHLKTGA